MSAARFAKRVAGMRPLNATVLASSSSAGSGIGVTPIEVMLPMRVRSPLNGSQGFSRGATMAAARERKSQRAVVALVLAGERLGPEALRSGSLVVTLTRIAPRQLDDDNLRGALKSVRDGVADWLGINDRDARVRWDYKQERRAPREYAVLVHVEPARAAKEAAVCT